MTRLSTWSAAMIPAPLAGPDVSTSIKTFSNAPPVVWSIRCAVAPNALESVTQVNFFKPIKPYDA